MSTSRNLGLRHARGEYIAFLDADDAWVPQTLARQVTLLESQPQAAMVYGPAQWWYSWTGKPEDGTRDFIQPLGVPPHTLITPPRLLLRFLRQPLFAPVGILARRAVIERIGGYEEAFRGLYEDQAFYAKLCLEAPVFAVPESWYQYRRHPGACCMVARQEGQGPAARLRFLHWLAAYVAEREGRRGRVWRAAQRELWRYRHPRLYRLFRQASYRRQQLARVADPMAWQRVLVHVHRRLRLYRPRHGG